MKPASRIDGFVPIGDYAVLGDGRTTALVASDGRLDWWPLPTLDAPPVCAALLDPDRGGYFSLAPIGSFEVDRRYLEGTNVLETTYATPSGRARVIEALNTGSGGRLPWTELAHRVDGLAGEVAMHWELVLGNRLGQARPWAELHGCTPVATIGDQCLAVVGDGIEPEIVEPHRLYGDFTVRAGRRAVVALVATDSEPLVIPSTAAIDHRISATIESWRQWSRLVDFAGPWSDVVRRSALTLKTLIAEDTGAIAAAATTSLPERIGGPKNWDYRYSWVRDSSFALDALINLGLEEEVHRAVSWLLTAVRLNGPDLHVFYTLGAELPGNEDDPEVPGYAGSRPVRLGNSAATQLQLGTFGDLFDTLHRYVDEGHLVDPGTGRLLADLADRCCDQWMAKDSGIWELGHLEHYTISKIGCWVALDRAARLADMGQIPPGGARRWRAEANEIRDWVNAHCWSAHKKSYTFFAGTEDLDAAVLLAARTGFERGHRLATTIDAVSSELGRGPFVYRYSGAEHEEGAFVACSFWMVEALVHAGRLDSACTKMDEAVGLTSQLGVLSEQIDPGTGEFLGNIPQGLSHLALINAASSLKQAVGPERSG